MVLLKDRRCASIRSKCSRKTDRPTGKTRMSPTISHNGAPMQNTGSGFVTWDGDITTSYCTMRSLTSGRLRELNEFRMRIIWNCTTSSEGRIQLPSNQRPYFAQAKRERKQLHDEHLARTKQTIIQGYYRIQQKTAIKATT